MMEKHLSGFLAGETSVLLCMEIKYFIFEFILRELNGTLGSEAAFPRSFSSARAYPPVLNKFFRHTSFYTCTVYP